jgi:hypothetical protein
LTDGRDVLYPEFVRKLLALTVVVACALPALAQAGVPARLDLVPGKSIAGVSLGERTGDVTSALGQAYTVCAFCAVSTKLYAHPGTGPLGLAVRLCHGTVSAIFTLDEHPAGGGSLASLQASYPGFAPGRFNGRPALIEKTANVETVVFGPGDYELTRTDAPTSG